MASLDRPYEWLNPAALRAHGVEPHYFGLGFIQFKISPLHRLHVWVPDWPVIPGAESEFHDHRNAFTSTVLAGLVEHEVAVLGPWCSSDAPGAQEVVAVSCKPSAAEDPRLLGYAPLVPVGVFRVAAHQSYSLTPDAFHRTRSEGPTVTWLKRGPMEREHARVLRPVGASFTCPFSLPRTWQECWDKVESVLASCPV